VNISLKEQLTMSCQRIMIRNDAGNTAHSLCCLIAFCMLLERGKEQKVLFVIWHKLISVILVLSLMVASTPSLFFNFDFHTVYFLFSVYK
jgi:hypothetical protein